MSWGALPIWVYDIAFEQQQAMMLGAMAEELNSGWTRATPKHIVRLDIDRRDDPEYRVFSLGVRIN